MGVGGGALEDLVMFHDLYRGRRVFVTGHTGFKGSWLSAWLHLLGAKVVGVALDPPTQPSHFDAANMGAMLEDHRGAQFDQDQSKHHPGHRGKKAFSGRHRPAALGQIVAHPVMRCRVIAPYDSRV